MSNPYLSPTHIRLALRALDIHPTRRMGQNFLIDPQALAAIVAAAELTLNDTVIEVGPGLGVLTWELVQRAARVVAVELDRRLAGRLQEEFASNSRLRLVQGDILNLPPEQVLAAPMPYRVVANLPYAITSPVLRHFLATEYRPELLVLLVQWEVAERIAAAPGDLSVLAHAVQIYAEPEIILRVPATSFWPAPAVDSAVLRLRVRPEPAAADPEGLLRLIKAGSLHARKQLGNALPNGLAAHGQRITREQAHAALERAGIAPERRAETLTLAEWDRLRAWLAELV